LFQFIDLSLAFLHRLHSTPALHLHGQLAAERGLVHGSFNSIQTLPPRYTAKDSCIMNCPSRTDEPEGTGMNQNPNSLAADLTTREDLNGMANARILRRSSSEIDRTLDDEPGESLGDRKGRIARNKVRMSQASDNQVDSPIDVSEGSGGGGRLASRLSRALTRTRKVIMKFGHFVGPGMMVTRYSIPFERSC
jgi:hypothetical protein